MTDNAGFTFMTVDARPMLPPDWAEQLRTLADREAVYRELETSSVTSREESSFDRIPSLTVDGTVVAAQTPWLADLYRGAFRDLATRLAGRPVDCATVDLYGAVLNVQRGRMRYECHVDSNPVQGLLYATTHRPGEGGELVVARNSEAHSVKQVDEDCTVIHPTAGQLLLFDARRWPHYVRELVDPDAVRIVVAMNFYTEDCPESARPADLDAHLFGREPVMTARGPGLRTR